jgi:hypothetical protein
MLRAVRRSRIRAEEDIPAAAGASRGGGPRRRALASLMCAVAIGVFAFPSPATPQTPPAQLPPSPDPPPAEAIPAPPVEAPPPEVDPAPEPSPVVPTPSPAPSPAPVTPSPSGPTTRAPTDAQRAEAAERRRAAARRRAAEIARARAERAAAERRRAQEARTSAARVATPAPENAVPLASARPAMPAQEAPDSERLLLIGLLLLSGLSAALAMAPRTAGPFGTIARHRERFAGLAILCLAAALLSLTSLI